MHACGHDGHVATLLCAAYHLKHNIEFNGVIYCIFQPAEEHGGGAAKMIEQGLFNICPMDNVFALHNWPGMPEGHFGLRTGGIMASSNEFRIDIQGKGGHAAMPEQTHDPIVCGALIIQAFQSILTRNISTFEQAVLSITQVHAGGAATNIIEDDMWIGGTVRTFNLHVLDQIEKRMHDIAFNIAQAHNCTIDFEFKRSYPPTINSEAETNMLAEVLIKTFGREYVNINVMPSMGAEDFSFMLQEKKGSYFFLGNGDGEGRENGHGLGPCQLHNDSYDFNDNLIKIGAKAWIALVQHYLV
jgi:amidohydrolase